MWIELFIILAFISLLIYSNYTGPVPPQKMVDRITFNPFSMASECPMGCDVVSLVDSDLTPSILMDVIPQRFCGFKNGTIVYPCPSKCCAKSLF